MQIIYKGPKAERKMDFPIPILSKSDIQGTVTFKRNQAVECRDEWAKQAMASAPEYFQPVPTKG